jgi:hypothetical protein
MRLLRDKQSIKIPGQDIYNRMCLRKEGLHTQKIEQFEAIVTTDPLASIEVQL